MLKKARQIAVDNSVKANDKKARPQFLNEGDKAYINNELFLGKKQEIC
jgi:hypothetical protein